jgi:hypothetical protein
MASDESEQWTLRSVIGVKLLDFPRERHRALLEKLAREQKEPFADFSAQDVLDAFSRMRDTPEWQRFGDPCKFYAPEQIAQRQTVGKGRGRCGWPDRDFPFDVRGVASERGAQVGATTPAPAAAEIQARCPTRSASRTRQDLMASAAAAPRRAPAHALRRNVYGQGPIEAWQYSCQMAKPPSTGTPHIQPSYLVLSPLVADENRGRATERSAIIDRRVSAAQAARRCCGYLNRASRPFSAFEILRADPGRSLLVKDLLTDAQHDVTERSASVTMQQSDLVFGQVAKAGGVTLLEASQGFAIPPLWKIKVIEFRQQRFAGAIMVAPERLREAEDALLVLYDDIATQLFGEDRPSRTRQRRSRRGAWCSTCPRREAFDALKHALADSRQICCAMRRVPMAAST